jgi:hypothetical protein
MHSRSVPICPRLFVESLVVHEFPNAPHPGIAASARGGLTLEAVITSDERVEIGLDPHPAKLLPAFHRIHRRPTVRIAVDEQDRTRREVERELRDEPRVVLVAALRIRGFRAVRERVSRIDRDRPLHVAGKLVKVVDRPIGTAFRAGRAHERQVSAGRGAHDADVVGIEPLRRGLAANDSDGALQILPRRRVLGQPAQRTWRAVFHRHDRHALFVQVAPRRRDFEAVRTVAHVSAARVDDLDRLRLEFLRRVPLEIRQALVRLHIRHLAFWPDRLLAVFAARIVVRIAGHQIDFRAETPVKIHLAKVLGDTVEPVVVGGAVLTLARVAHETVGTVREEMDLGRDFHPAELAVDLRGTVRRIDVRPSVEERHRTRLRVELEHVRELYVDRVALARVGAGESIRERVGGVDRHRPVYVAWKLVEFVDRPVRWCERARREQDRQVRARGEPERSDLLRVESSFLRIVADETDGALPILPRALVDRQPLRTRRPVGEAHANEPEFGELFRDPVNPHPVAATLITAAGNEQHASAVFLRRCLVPVEIRHRMIRRLESRRLHLLGGRRDLTGLEIRDLSFRPQRDLLPRERQNGYQEPRTKNR